MHELSIALNILDIASRESERHGDAEVKAIHVRLGELSGVVAEALVSAFDLAREGSPLANCELEIEHVPIAIYCAACEAERPIASFPVLTCPQCGAPAADVRQGSEMEVTALEIEMGCEADARPASRNEV